MVNRQSFTRVELAVVAAILLVLALLLWPAIRSAWEESRRATCKNNLRQIVVALHAYHDQYESFPPAHVLGPDGKRWHSWRVLILPFLGQQKLYDEYRFNESWDGPHNRSLKDRMPDVFACPDSDRRREGVTSYLAVVGRAAAFPQDLAVRLKDFHDGASNTIMLVESDDAGIHWTEPRDIPHQNVVLGGDAPEPPRVASRHQGWHAALADGAVRLISPQIRPDVLKKLLTINGGQPPPGVAMPLDELTDAPPLPPVRPAAEMPGTNVVPHPSAALSAGRNTVYCATFAIAWGELRKLAGGDPVKLSSDPPLAEALNQFEFDPGNLDEESYLARVGKVDGDLIEQIRQELSLRFPSATPRLPDRAELGRNQFLIYSYLQKSLPFGEKFNVLEAPLEFRTTTGTVRVASFGVHEFDDFGPRAAQLKSQMTILDYAHDDDFIIEFHTRATNDRMILAKIEPRATLADTIDDAQRRIAKPDPSHTARELHSRETLAIPRLILGVDRDYSELTGHDFLNAQLSGNVVRDAAQVIQFRLDETGAELVSEVEIIGENGHTPSKPGKRRFIFDRPFLIYLIQKDADQPYFAAWIENAELMEAGR
ncbi:MAG: DUF1559 domain-containing protein [Planctomycetaceae bacterium]|nr:DUF1559 domain-containing protein [Planctomycetaceae bacterium]